MKKIITITCLCVPLLFWAQGKKDSLKEGNKKAEGSVVTGKPLKPKYNNLDTTNVTNPTVDKAADNVGIITETGKGLNTGKRTDEIEDVRTDEGKNGVKKREEMNKKNETVTVTRSKKPETGKSTEENYITSKTQTGVIEYDTINKTQTGIYEKKREGIKKKKNKEINTVHNIENIKMRRNFCICLLLLLGFFSAWIYYLLKNKKLRHRMGLQKLSLKEIIKKQEALFNQFVEFSKEKLNVDDLEKKIEFINPTSEKSFMKSEKAEYQEFITRIKNNISSLSKGIHAISEDLSEKEDMIIRLKQEAQEPNLSENYLKLGQEKQELEKENASLRQQFTSFENSRTSVIPNYSIPPDVHISSSILVSAGPRKEKESDTELGEDSSGIYNTAYGTYFWVLDGTSDSGRIEFQQQHVFSSRVLSQQLGHAILTIVSDKEYEKSGNGDTLKDILKKAIREAKINIQQILKNTSVDVHQQIAAHIRENQKPYCSTTLLLGLLDKMGNLWYVYLGDSQVYSFHLEKQELIPDKSHTHDGKGRFFLSLSLSSENTLVFESNSYEEKMISPMKKTGIDLVMAFSDGIGSSEKALRISPKQVLSKISISQQKSYDDKSLIVLERKNFYRL